MVAFPFFRPDQGELKSGLADNVVLRADGSYGPRRMISAAPGAAALAAAPRGAVSVIVGGSYSGFVATASEVYKLASDYSWTALSAALTVPDGDDEYMTQFGVFLIGTNTADGMYAYNVSSPSGWNAISGSPDARVVFATNNLLIALGDGSNLSRMANSAFGDQTNWATKGALKKDFNEGGDFTAGGDLGGGAAVVMQQNVVRRLSFGDAGGGALYRVDDISKGIGCTHYRSAIFHNKRAAFLSENGFMMTDGASVIPIGSQKVNQWFKDQGADYTKVYGAADPVNNIFWWWFTSAGTTLARGLGFDWVMNEWVTATENIAAIFRMATPGYTLEDLDSFGTLDSLPYSLDSRFWKGGRPNLAGLTSDYKFGFFDGDNAAATLETQTLGSGTSDYVNMAVPLTDDPNATMQVGTKDALNASISWSDAESILDDGRVPFLERGKWQRYRINHASGAVWGSKTGTIGVEGIDIATGGPR